MKLAHALLMTGVALAWTGPAAAWQAPDANAAYEQALEAAERTFEFTRARCDVIAGIAHEICITDARAARVRAEEEAGAAHKNTLAAYTQARMRIASAYYDRDRTRCGALAGNDREVCLQQAKATLVATRADARADRKAIEARLDARDEKIAAEYRVALQKCDAYAGAIKDQCVSTARMAYGK